MHASRYEKQTLFAFVLLWLQVCFVCCKRKAYMLAVVACVVSTQLCVYMLCLYTRSYACICFAYICFASIHALHLRLLRVL